MAYLITFVLFVVSLAIEGSVFALAGPDGVHPDPLLVVVVALAVLAGMRKGAVLGLCAGLLQDIIFGAPLGFFAAVKLPVGALAGLIAEDIYKDFILAPMLLVAFFTLSGDVFIYFLAKLFDVPIVFSLRAYLQNYILPRMLMHFFLMGLLYPFLYRAHKRKLLFEESYLEE
ncbi:MAG: rod shape-determining protein MreD [Firmicutes bacterium]|nr:rod shape-determining protein MreD [Bacillota bacterium]